MGPEGTSTLSEDEALDGGREGTSTLSREEATDREGSPRTYDMSAWNSMRGDGTGMREGSI